MSFKRTREIRFNGDLSLLQHLQLSASAGDLGDTPETQAANIVAKLSQGASDQTLDRWITNDPAMLRIKSRLKAVIRTSSATEPNPPVLITGPTGTGKELLARALTVPGSPFVTENCGGLAPELVTSTFFGHKKGSFTGANTDYTGKLVAAEDGIIFLDEIGDLPMKVQALLLRAIQENEITPVGSVVPQAIACRFVAATKYNLEELVSKGAFRDDLYARLMTFHFDVTSLKERPSDIPLIAHYLGHDEPFDEPTIQRIHRYNVRAIQTAIQRWRTYGSYD